MRNQYRSVCLYGPQSVLSWSMADATRVGGEYIEVVNEVNKQAKITGTPHCGVDIEFAVDSTCRHHTSVAKMQCSSCTSNHTDPNTEVDSNHLCRRCDRDAAGHGTANSGIRRMPGEGIACGLHPGTVIPEKGVQKLSQQDIWEIRDFGRVGAC